MTIIRSFTDKYGIPWTDTTLHISYATETASVATAYQESDAYAPLVYPEEKYVSYGVCYWVSQAEKDAGSASFIFEVHISGQPNSDAGWNFKLTSDYDGLTIVEACEKHFINYVFPDGQPAGQYNPTTLV